MTEEELLAEVTKLAREVAVLRSAVARLVEHVLGAQYDELVTMLATDISFAGWPGRPGPPSVPLLAEREH